MSATARPHSRQTSLGSSFTSSSAMGLGINNNNGSKSSSQSTPSKNHPVKIGPWKLGRTLGRGATGRVLLASNARSGRKAAVKVVNKAVLNMNPDISETEKGCDSAGLSYGIEREIIIMKLLNHKNVLRLYDVYETEKALYLVLEYVEGGELFDLLVESGPLPEATAVEFFKQIILGASYCHNLGICHRDLKPENLLLDRNLSIKIADFGMAALESKDRLLETSCGSPHYAAPEIVSGLKYHGTASDVWSCGVILFALLTGRLPFDDENVRNVLLKVQSGRYSYQEDDEVSDEAKDLIARMLTVDPTKRILSRDILKHRLIQKYPFNEQDMNDYLNLPPAESATRPVNSREELDEDILKNLVILWHGRDEESIIQDLLSSETNQVKTFYSLLVRYRHDNKLKNSSELVRSSSVISKISTNSNTPKRRSKRYSNSISASSAHRRSVTYQKSNVSTSTPTKPKRDSSSYNLPVLPTGSYNELVNIQRSGVQNSPERVTPDRSSPQRTPHRSPHRSPHRNSHKSSPYRSSPNRYHNSVNVSASPSRKRASMISLANSFSNNKRASLMLANDPNQRINVRNSVTTKLLSTYAKLSSLEEKENVDDYGKRTSADFGKLCELLFNGENKEAAALASSSSMATLSALIFDDAQSQLSPRKQNRRISASPRKRASRRSHRQPSQMTKKQSEYATALLNHIEQEIEEYKEYENEDAEYNDKVIRLLPDVEDPPVREIHPAKRSNKKNKSRISSNPLERISRILNPKDFEKMDRRTVSAKPEDRRKSSLQYAAPISETPATPPKPISRLDPRYGAYKQYKRRVSQDAQRLLEATIAEEEEKERRRIREEKEAAARRAAEEAALAAEAEAEAARRVYEVRNGGRLNKNSYRHSSYSKRNSIKPKRYDNEDSDNYENEEDDEYNQADFKSKAKKNARSARSKARQTRDIEGEETETSTPGFTEDETTETATGTETETDYPEDTEDDYYGYEDEYMNGAAATTGRNKSGKYSSRARDEFDNQSTAGTITKEFMADLKKAHIIDSQFSGLRIQDESSNALSSNRRISNNRLSSRYSRGGDYYDPNGIITSKNSVRKNSKRNSMLPPSTIADVVVPEVTRRSKQFPGNSNRLSVLSIYSTKESSTNIHGLLNSTGNESGKNPKSARHSHLFLEDPINLRDDNRKIGQIQEDDEFNFIDNSNGLSSKRKSIADDLQNFGKYEDGKQGKSKKDNIPNLKYKASNDTLISKDSEGELYKTYKIPEIPGSPLKDSAHETNNFDVRIASSKYSTEKLDAEDRKYSSLLADDNGQGKPETDEAGKSSTYNNSKRKPLGEIDIETQKRNENKSNVIKPTHNNDAKKEKVKSSEVRTSSGNSFLRKISFGKRSSSNEDENQRKSSFASAFLSLFQSHNGNDQVKKTAEIKSVLDKNDIFEALRSLLVSWKQHGVENLIITSHSYSMSAGISKNNALGLKTCRFNVEALPVPTSKSDAHSKLVFHNLKGSNRTFERLVNEIQRILEKEGVLAA